MEELRLLADLFESLVAFEERFAVVFDEERFVALALGLGSPESDFVPAFGLRGGFDAGLAEAFALLLDAEAFLDELDLPARSDFFVATSFLSVLDQSVHADPAASGSPGCGRHRKEGSESLSRRQCSFE